MENCHKTVLFSCLYHAIYSFLKVGLDQNLRIKDFVSCSWSNIVIHIFVLEFTMLTSQRKCDTPKPSRYCDTWNFITLSMAAIYNCSCLVIAHCMLLSVNFTPQKLWQLPILQQTSTQPSEVNSHLYQIPHGSLINTKIKMVSKISYHN